jgi:hypothetical protein
MIQPCMLGCTQAPTDASRMLGCSFQVANYTRKILSNNNIQSVQVTVVFKLFPEATFLVQR